MDIFGTESANDHQRYARSVIWLDDLRRDTIYALRTLRPRPHNAHIAAQDIHELRELIQVELTHDPSHTRGP